MLRHLSSQLRAAPILQQSAPSPITSPASTAVSAHAGPSSRPWQPRHITTDTDHLKPSVGISSTQAEHDTHPDLQLTPPPHLEGDGEKPQVTLPPHNVSDHSLLDKKNGQPLAAKARKQPPLDFSLLLYRTLMAQIYAHTKQPDGEEIWTAYYNHFQPNAIRQGAPSLLKSLHHRMVLRTISPTWPRIRLFARASRRASRASRDEEGEDELASLDPTPIRKLLKKEMLDEASSDLTTSSKLYSERVVFVLARLTESQMRGSDEGPTMADYNHVLRNAARTGDLHLAELIWQQIHDRGLCPDQWAYLSMISANSRSIIQIANSPWAAKRKLTRNELVLLRRPSVVLKSRAAAERVIHLIDDMVRREIKPSSRILDYTLNLLRLGGYYESFETLLKAGYNIDLTRLEAQDQEGTPSDKPRPSVATLHLIILALGDRKTVSEMLAAFSILTRPSPKTAAITPPTHVMVESQSASEVDGMEGGRGAAEAEPPAIDKVDGMEGGRGTAEAEPPAIDKLPFFPFSSFQKFVHDLFLNDANALDKTSALDEDARRVGARFSASSTSKLPRIIPNSAIYEGLITHCCVSYNGSGVSEAEADARRLGAYRTVVKYVFLDMFDGYRDAIGKLVASIGLREAEGAVLEPTATFGQSFPTVCWPRAYPKMQHWSPFFSFATHRRDVASMRWLSEKVREAKVLLMKEELALRFGARLWKERPASNAREEQLIESLCNALSQRADFVAKESKLIEAWSNRHLRPRMAHLSAYKLRKLKARQVKAQPAAEEQVRASESGRRRQKGSDTTSSASDGGALSRGPPIIALGNASSRALHTCAGPHRGRRSSASPLTVPLPQSLYSARPFLRATFAASRHHLLAQESHHPNCRTHQHADAVIVGGGVVGLALACSLLKSESLASSSSLAGFPHKLVVLEASSLDRLTSWAQEKQAKGDARVGDDNTGLNWENRVVSLTMENWLWLQDLGVTDFMVHTRIQPVASMHISDGISGVALDLGEGSGARSASSTSSGSPLSKMVELSNLQQAMLRFLKRGSLGVQVEVRDETKVEGIVPSELDSPSSAVSQHADAWPVVHTTSPTSKESFRPRLLIGADGGSSPVRKYAGIDRYGWGYGCNGLVGILDFDEGESARRGDQVAYQRFLPTGTIAWLPLSNKAASTVWTLPPDLAKVMTTLHRSSPSDQPSILADLITAAWRLPWASLSYIFSLIRPSANNAADSASLDISLLRQEIKGRLQAASRAGTLVSEEEVPPPVVDVARGSVASFPLQVAHADAYLGSSLLSTASPSNSLLPASLLHSALSLTGLGGKSDVSHAKGRTVLIGDAAHSIHPLAGQGLNLGLRDARLLTEVLGRAVELGGDWGSHDSLKPYEQQTYLHNQVVLSAVDHLHWLYAGTPVPTSLDYQDPQRTDDQQPLARKMAKDLFGRSVVWARSTGVEMLNELDWVKGKMQGFAGSKGASGGDRKT